MEYTLINKYLSGNATEEEVEKIFKWIETSSENKATFIKYKKTWALTIESSGDYELARQQVLIKIKRRKRRKSLSKLWKYAAILIGFIGIYFFVIQNETTDIQDGQLIIAEENIILELDNGKVKVIDANGKEKIIDKSGKIAGTQIGNLIDYKSENEVEELVYNKLTVPYGKKFQIILSDGTKVHLNAGTSLKYPVKFIKGENRQVFLDGEAYFEVTKDESNPFVVSADEIDIRVLGTQFNVSSYPEDDHINTVLIEGAVSVYNKDEAYNPETTTILKPGFKAAWEKKNNQIVIEEADTEMYTAWINGRIIFRHTSFKNIIKKLERHYNVVIVNNNEALSNEQFAASFDIETIEQVLKSFNANYAIDYTIKNNQIIIN